jgi:glucosamine kinase
MGANPLVIGIDGGQTSTRAVLCNFQGQVLGRAAAGPWELLESPEAQRRCRGHLMALLEQLAQQHPLKTVTQVALGLTGGKNGLPLVEGWITDHLPQATARVYHDSRTNYAGANPQQGPGVLIIAGGGSIAWGLAPGGRDAFAGGWGYLLDDVGSGYEMSRQAILAVLRAWQQMGPSTQLEKALLAHFGYREVWDLRMAIYRLERPQIAGILPVLAQTAAEDPVAQGILQAGGRGLAQLAVGVMQQLDFWDPLVFPTGGAFRVSQVDQAFASELARLAPAAQVGLPRLPPLAGCVVLALAALGPISADQIAQLEQNPW